MPGATSSTESLGFFGSEMQTGLQKIAQESRARIAQTPGLFFSGRMIGIDDFDALGEQGVQALLQEQGMLNTRLIPIDRQKPWTERFEADELRVDSAIVLMGDANDVRAAIAPIVLKSLPDGLHIAQDLSPGDVVRFSDIQNFLVANGLAPVYGASLVESPESSTVVIQDESGSVRAVAHTYFPHNRFSAYCRSAWGGLVAVDPALRALGLGRFVNALMLERAIYRLGAEHVYEIASQNNEASLRMISSCGLSVRPDLTTSFIVPLKADRFTR